MARTPKQPPGGADEDEVVAAAPRPRRARTTKDLSAAGPEKAPRSPRAPRRPKSPPERVEELVSAVRTSLEDDKAEDIQVLDVTGRASFTDRMVIATGLA